MFRQVFDPDNLFWRIMARGVDFVGLSISGSPSVCPL